MKSAILECMCRKPSLNEDGVINASFCFPKTFIGFQGHFPGKPILPAVVQVQVAQVCICSFGQEELRISKLVSGKFLEMVDIETVLEVECESRGDGQYSCKVTNQSSGHLVSSFRLYLA